MKHWEGKDIDRKKLVIRIAQVLAKRSLRYWENLIPTDKECAPETPGSMRHPDGKWLKMDVEYRLPHDSYEEMADHLISQIETLATDKDLEGAHGPHSPGSLLACVFGYEEIEPIIESLMVAKNKGEL